MYFFRIFLVLIAPLFVLTSCEHSGVFSSASVSGEMYTSSLSDEEKASLAKNRIKQIREIRK
jgi:hypothetical protein